ncbi:hypothetical protein H2204_014455 [Knufia peltigerae]|uniref:DUF7924 domain-containing protein n=1 Tax=Knufia peltigerae TaxID=1002370 RepID=A0AA38XKN9_9EURO|nr:hypothetical protein H2204_014455 [Knufia peltigerae]
MFHPTKGLQRCHAPKMSREALPPRTVKAQESLFELPAPRPSLLTGFTTSAFDEGELLVLPNSAASTGTLVDFDSGCVSLGTTVYCPFLVFERLDSSSEDGFENARNQCAIVGAHCIRALQLLFRRCNSPWATLDRLVSFSCSLDNAIAIINYHFIDSEGRYCMAEISRFNLNESAGYCEFQAWIEAVEDWATCFLKPVIKNALRQLLRTNGTPPVSPMPSLTLSIDTAPGSDDCDEEYETPLNSSIAHCGTPFGARKIRTMALSSASPVEIFSATPSSATPFSRWRMKADWNTRSPSSRRFPLSPLKLRPEMPDSPIRRPTLSPCTPPPDAPFSAKSPMLVLQKRVDLAMDEIQELRALVQALQGELKLKDSQFESEMEKKQPVSTTPQENELETPTSATSKEWSEPTQSTIVADWFDIRIGLTALPVLYLAFFLLGIALGHDLLEILICTILSRDNYSIISLK